MKSKAIRWEALQTSSIPRPTSKHLNSLPPPSCLLLSKTNACLCGPESILCFTRHHSCKSPHSLLQHQFLAFYYINTICWSVKIGIILLKLLSAPPFFLLPFQQNYSWKSCLYSCHQFLLLPLALKPLLSGFYDHHHATKSALITATAVPHLHPSDLYHFSVLKVSPRTPRISVPAWESFQILRKSHVCEKDVRNIRKLTSSILPLLVPHSIN